VLAGLDLSLEGEAVLFCGVAEAEGKFSYSSDYASIAKILRGQTVGAEYTHWPPFGFGIMEARHLLRSLTSCSGPFGGGISHVPLLWKLVSVD
jgi:hypothetical protein